MHLFGQLIRAIITVGMTSLLFVNPSIAVEPESMALKAGETIDLGALYWVSNCRSELKTTPVAEIMEGPAELSVNVKAQPVMPRSFNCAKPVPGGELFLIAAPNVKTRLQGQIFIRIKYPTKDGERQHLREISYTIFPPPPTNTTKVE